MSNMFKSLFSRMLATYLSVTLGLLLLLGVTVISIFDRQYIEQKKNEIMRESAELHDDIISKYLDDAKRAVAREEILLITRKYNSVIHIIFNDPTLGIAVFVDEDASEKWSMIKDLDMTGKAKPVISGSIDNVVVSDNIFSDIIDMRTLTVSRPLVNNKKVIGAMFFSIDMTDAYDALQDIYFDVLFSGLLATVLAIFAVWYITSRITKPIINMQRIVSQFAKGKFDARLTINGEDEVSMLASSINSMADELNTLENARQSFVANVSHELRSPLTSMRGFLVAMQDGTISASDYPVYLQIVTEECTRMTLMVNDLLDLAKIESGQQTVNFESFDINELIRRTLITFLTRINDKVLDVHMEFDVDLCIVEADSSQIAQVLRNLIDNAIKYSPDGGILSITVRTSKAKAVIAVKDSGSGIPESDIPFIFDRFYKVEKAHTRSKTNGTGLGLAIAKRIVDAHGQTIRVKNDNGAMFYFTLDRAKPRPLKYNSEALKKK